ncbi:MAG TPA: hypothetical protein VG448_11490 [Solirubrobacterales bacterium]|nr:hypothetical protein [Solirubrobacterales bacterium]
MKEHVLSDGDRAALQSLIPLASAVGITTLFKLFFSARQRTAFAIFEIFAIVSVLVAAALTASIAISLMHQNTAITGHELTETAMPLVVAGFLLVFMIVPARLREAGDRNWSMLPIGLAGAYVAAVAILTLRVWTATPESAALFAGGLLAVGALLSLGVNLWESRAAHGSRRGRARELAKTIAAGYTPARKRLRPSLPEPDGTTAIEVACWVKKGRTYMGLNGCERLRDLVQERWDAMGEAGVQPPTGSSILAAIDVRYRIPFRRTSPEVRISTVQVPGGAGDTQAAPMNEDGLIDVSDLGLL